MLQINFDNLFKVTIEGSRIQYFWFLAQYFPSYLSFLLSWRDMVLIQSRNSYIFQDFMKKLHISTSKLGNLPPYSLTMGKNHYNLHKTMNQQRWQKSKLQSLQGTAYRTSSNQNYSVQAWRWHCKLMRPFFVSCLSFWNYNHFTSSETSIKNWLP